MAEQPGLGSAVLLRQLRARALLTPEELAEAASASPRSVSDLERGSTGLPARTPLCCWPMRWGCGAGLLAGTDASAVRWGLADDPAWFASTGRLCAHRTELATVKMSRSRRNGLVTLALLIGATAVALTLADVYHLGGAQTLVTALVGGGAPAGLYLAWAQYRDTAAGTEAAAAMNLARVADRLADEVRDQWQWEASALNQPHPLPVRWEAADPSLFDDWAALTRVASSGVGWPVPPRAGRWAARRRVSWPGRTASWQTCSSGCPPVGWWCSASPARARPRS